MTATTQTQTEAVETQTDDATIEALCENMTAAGIRAWMSANDISRPRGANKFQSLERAMERAPEETRKLARSIGRDYDVRCNCGVHAQFATAHAAQKFAKQHKSAKNTHFPRARGPENERIYG